VLAPVADGHRLGFRAFVEQKQAIGTVGVKELGVGDACEPRIAAGADTLGTGLYSFSSVRDNIIMREEISRLDETNKNLENEISQNREIISQLQSENQKLNEENALLKTKINDYDNQNYSQLYINGQISKEDFLQKSFNERYLLQNKLKDLESNYSNMKRTRESFEKIANEKEDIILRYYESKKRKRI